jgi:hypothetical protein
MPTQLEERLRRYGETFERAIHTDVRPEPAHPAQRVPARRRRVVVALGAAVAVVGIAAVITVMIHPASQPPTVTSRQQQHLPSLGVDWVWPGPEASELDRSDPTATAGSFTRNVVDEAPAGVAPEPTARPNDPTWVTITLTNGISFRILCVLEAPNRWVVLQVGNGDLGVGTMPSEVIVGSSGTQGERADLMWRDTAGVHVATPPREESVDEKTWRIPITISGTLHSAVVVVRDGSGAPIDVVGGHLRATYETVTDSAPVPGEMRSTVRVLVLNAGQLPGTDVNKSNQLRALGYNTLPSADAPTRSGVAVQCREGSADAATVLAADVGEGARVEPFVEPPTGIGAQDTDCIVYMGR